MQGKQGASEEDEIIDPVDDWFNLMEFQECNHSVHYVALDSTTCGKAFNINMLDVMCLSRRCRDIFCAKE